MDKVLISMENLDIILTGFINELYSRINNKNIAIPYTNLLKKSEVLKTDGNGNMFLCNNGNYCSIDIKNINKDESMMDTIYKLFKIEKHEESEWNIGKPMITSRKGLTSQIYNKKIYCIGGYNNDIGWLDILEIYDISTDTWSIGKSMFTERDYLTSSISNNKIYCIGGYKRNKLNDVEIYDIESDTWTTGKPMPTGRYSLTSQICNDKIYCIGGTTGDNYGRLYTLEIYDIKSDTWTTGKPMPTDRYSLTSNIYNNKIYCIGGDGYHSNLNTVEIYDIETDTWSTSKPMPTGRKELISEMYNNKIYCIGGSNSNYLNTVEIYDIETNTWSTDKNMSTERKDFTSSLYHNKIYCIGGYNKRGDINTVDILSPPYTDYDIKLPKDIDNKLNMIKTDGTGNKMLSDNGNYILPNNNYNIMNQDQVSYLLNKICKEV